MDGQVLVGLDINPFRLNCKGDVEYISKTYKLFNNNISKNLYIHFNFYILADDKVESFLTSILNYSVILICTISMILCLRAIYRAQQLKYVSHVIILFSLYDVY